MQEQSEKAGCDAVSFGTPEFSSLLVSLGHLKFLLIIDPSILIKFCLETDEWNGGVGDPPLYKLNETRQVHYFLNELSCKPGIIPFIHPRYIKDS